MQVSRKEEKNTLLMEMMGRKGFCDKCLELCQLIQKKKFKRDNLYDSAHNVFNILTQGLYVIKFVHVHLNSVFYDNKVLYVLFKSETLEFGCLMLMNIYLLYILTPLFVYCGTKIMNKYEALLEDIHLHLHNSVYSTHCNNSCL